MKICIADKEIHLNNHEVHSAKEVVADFIDKIKKIAMDKGCPTYYFTTLIVMHAMSQKLIAEMEPDTLSIIMDRLKIKNAE